MICYCRSPDSFKDQVVVVVGCRPSGTDIALELHEATRNVHISVKSMDDGVTVFPGMRQAVSRHHNLHLHLQASFCSFMDMHEQHTYTSN